MVFSNSTQWDIWAGNWCYQCKKDLKNDCPIILSMLLGETPPEIERRGPYESQVFCSEFERIEQ